LSTDLFNRFLRAENIAEHTINICLDETAAVYSGRPPYRSIGPDSKLKIE